MVYAQAYRGSVYLPEHIQVAEAYAQRFRSIKKWNCQVSISEVENLNDENFRCVATFNSSKNINSQKTEISNRLTFKFKLKEYYGPSGCNGINQSKSRKCWELETTLPENIM